MNQLPRNQILTGDAATTLRRLPEASIDCAVTSPPYFGLRDYAADGQLGLESSVDEWVEGLRVVAREVARVLKPSGAFWLNLGDSFSRHEKFGAAPKALLLAPERLLLALAADGWMPRNKVIWSKTNAMPSSVRDRLALTWEALYLLVRSPSYYFELDAIREPHSSFRHAARVIQPHGSAEPEIGAGPLAASRGGLAKLKASGEAGHPLGKNPGDVWRVGTSSGYRGAHFATFPPALVRRPILCSCPPLVCSDCGLPVRAAGGPSHPVGPSCDRPVDPRPGVVLDPFFGSGTVGLVAAELGRDWLGVELQPGYVSLAQERLGLIPEQDLQAAA